MGSLSVAYLQPFINILFGHLQYTESNIEIFTALRIINNLARSTNIIAYSVFILYEILYNKYYTEVDSNKIY